MQINKIILEEIQEYISETFISVSEIRKLSDRIIKRVSKILNENLTKDGRIYKMPTIKLETIDSSGFKEIKEFVDSVNLSIDFHNKTNNVAGSYETLVSKELTYDPNYDFKIGVNIDDLNAEIWLLNAKHKEGDSISEWDMYQKMYRLINNTLIHELQHAYDDFRSKNKIFHSKRHDKYFEKKDELNKQDQINQHEKNIKEKIKQLQRYTKLESEIWGRFIQAIDNTYFTTVDYTVKDRFAFIMRPLRDVVRDFKYEFRDYNVLTEKQKKNIIRRVSQFWHYEKENLEKEGK